MLSYLLYSGVNIPVTLVALLVCLFPLRYHARPWGDILAALGRTEDQSSVGITASNSGTPKPCSAAGPSAGWGALPNPCTGQLGGTRQPS